MRVCACLLVAVVALAGCERADLVGVDPADQERPSRRFEEAAMLPMCSALYRVGGTHDPQSQDYDPSDPDTALLHVAHTFAWSGRDPSGVCDPLVFRHSLDGGEFSAWETSTSCVVESLSSDAHDITVRPGCPAVPGLEERFEFVVNYDPDSRIVEPVEPSGVLTVADGDTLWLRVVAHDREEIEGVGGGIAEIAVTMGYELMTFEATDVAEWWWSSNADPESGHHILSSNSPQGGNAPHMIEVRALDVDGRWETPSPVAEDRESFLFWYNFAPTVTILYPTEGDTIGSDFTVLWQGEDVDGDVVSYQYVLDPWLNAYRVTEQCQASYTGVDPGPHEFRVRGVDASGCWSYEFDTVTFYVE